MNSPTPIRVRSSEEAATQIPWWAALLTLAIVAICLLNGLGALGLVGPDEPRYMAIARTMLQSGDWVTPRLYGQPWFEKPVLCYWAAAVAFRLFGVNEFAARLPAALAALLATAAMAWAALRSYGLDAAWLTLLMVPTTVAGIGFARAASPDMLFSALLVAAAACAAEILSTRHPGRLARVAFGVSLGAATLAKGPAALLLAGGAAFLWAALSRQWSAVFRLLHPLCLASLVAVAAPWYALCAWRNPEFLSVFVLEHNFSRYLTSMFHHGQPFWFFGPVLVAAILPWSLLILPLLASAIRKLRGNLSWQDSPALFFGCWAVFPVLFFTFSESKLPGYVLPAVPPLVLLIAVLLAQHLNDGSKGTRWWVALVGCTFPAVSLIAASRVSRLSIQSALAGSEAPTVLAALAVVGGLACAFLALSGRLRPAIAMVGALTAVMLVGVNKEIVPKVDPLVSPRAAARVTSQEALASGNVAVLQLGGAWEYGLDFYLDRALPEWSPALPAPTLVWTTERGAAELERQASTSVILRVSQQAWLVRIEGEKQTSESGDTTKTAYQSTSTKAAD